MARPPSRMPAEMTMASVMDLNPWSCGYWEGVGAAPLEGTYVGAAPEVRPAWGDAGRKLLGAQFLTGHDSDTVGDSDFQDVPPSVMFAA